MRMCLLGKRERENLFLDVLQLRFSKSLFALSHQSTANGISSHNYINRLSDFFYYTFFLTVPRISYFLRVETRNDIKFRMTDNTALPTELRATMDINSFNLGWAKSCEKISCVWTIKSCFRGKWDKSWVKMVKN
jgi:hypothetical protein